MKHSFPLFHLVILVVLLILFAITISLYLIKPVQINEEISFSENYVIRVIDGDTFEIYSGESVRLLCIDAPELGDAGSYEAKDFLEDLILDKEVRLEKDVSETDKYGRLLRYVWVDFLGEEVFVNKEIVKEGYGVVFEYGDDTKYCDVIGGKE